MKWALRNAINARLFAVGLNGFASLAHFFPRRKFASHLLVAFEKFGLQLPNVNLPATAQ